MAKPQAAEQVYCGRVFQRRHPGSTLAPRGEDGKVKVDDVHVDLVFW